VPDIFISYSRLDRDRVAPLAERLASLGYSVWWNTSEQSDSDQAREAARIVLAVWSRDGRNAAELHADALYALDAGKLLQLKLDAIAPPAPFDAITTADMSGAGEWGPLEQALARLSKSGEGAAKTPSANLGPAPTLAASGSPKLVAIATILILAAFAGALGAAFNGVMTPQQLQIALVGTLGVAGACAGLSAHRLFTLLRAAG
jgi:hypothetical protein